MHFEIRIERRIFAFSRLLHFNFLVERFETDGDGWLVGGLWSFDGGEFSSFP